ncbi:hypothetical protein [uncultured Tateyamaria sp.]|uniref:lipopolysaccharide biosynthesis protein n=1 Tax=Tateyamaria sp. 1078 TaxID=3417464 RepID=UPI00261357F2|nr:hypothetical protein [uncultured Tateyamaria sp.]
MMQRLRNSGAARLFGTAGIVLAVRVSGTLLTLTYTLLMIGVAPPEEVGHAFAALSAGFLLSVVVSLNVEAGSIRFLPLYFENERKADASGYVFWCRRTVLVMTAGLMIPAVAILIWRNGLAELGPYLLSFAAAPIIANGRINSRHGIALGLVLRAALPRMLVRPVFMTAALGTANLMDLDLSATQIMVAFFVASSLATGLQWLLIRHAMAFRHETKPDYSEARDWVPFGLMLSPMLVMNEYMRNLIILTSGIVLMPADVARLGISLSMISVLNFGLNAFDMVFSPKISRATAQDKPRRRAKLLTVCGAGKLVALVVGVPLAWVFIPYVLGFMGKDYAGIEDMFLALAIIPASKAIFGPANLVLNVTGHKKILFWCALIGAGGIVLGTLAGHAIDGTRGVIIGAALAAAFYQALLFTMCRWHTGTDTTVLSLMWDKRRQVAA